MEVLLSMESNKFFVVSVIFADALLYFTYFSIVMGMFLHLPFFHVFWDGCLDLKLSIILLRILATAQFRWGVCYALATMLVSKSVIKSLNTQYPVRAANNGWSTDNVRSELGIDQTNLWMAGHFVQSLTDSFREILVFDYLIIMRGSIHVSERKKNEYETRQISGQEIPGCHTSAAVIWVVTQQIPQCHQYLSRPQIIESFQVVKAFTFG